MDEQTINKTCAALSAAIMAFRNAELIAIGAKNALAVTKLQKLASGEISGKNEDERKACALVVLADLVGADEISTINEKTAKTDLDLARLEFDRVNMLLRLEELIAGKAG
jgi:hypothetical protein